LPRPRVGLQFRTCRPAFGLYQIAPALNTGLGKGAVARSTVRADVIRAGLRRLDRFLIGYEFLVRGAFELHVFRLGRTAIDA
jgi:hypothetical protein